MGHNMVLSYNYAKQKKPAETNECTSATGHLDGRAEVLKGYMQHRLMLHVQGYSGSHWMLPLGNYWLRIALTVARVTANKTKM